MPEPMEDRVHFSDARESYPIRKVSTVEPGERSVPVKRALCRPPQSSFKNRLSSCRRPHLPFPHHPTAPHLTPHTSFTNDHHGDRNGL